MPATHRKQHNDIDAYVFVVQVADFALEFRKKDLALKLLALAQ